MANKSKKQSYSWAVIPRSMSKGQGAVVTLKPTWEGKLHTGRVAVRNEIAKIRGARRREFMVSKVRIGR